MILLLLVQIVLYFLIVFILIRNAMSSQNPAIDPVLRVLIPSKISTLSPPFLLTSCSQLICFFFLFLFHHHFRHSFVSHCFFPPEQISFNSVFPYRPQQVSTVTLLMICTKYFVLKHWLSCLGSVWCSRAVIYQVKAVCGFFISKNCVYYVNIY